MISHINRTARVVTLALLSASVVVSPTQAQERTTHQPASPAVPNEAPQATDSAEHVIAIPVPLPLPGQLQSLPR
ncbi:MAG: P-type conjugative transfer protein TrbG, partial [Sphingopyxis sp.]